jgi:hypothetical protein
MPRRIEDSAEGKKHVGGDERRPVGKTDAVPQFEFDLASAIENSPRCGQLGLERLCRAVQANEYAARQEADHLARLFGSHERIECPGLGAGAAQLAAGMWPGDWAATAKRALANASERHASDRP